MDIAIRAFAEARARKYLGVPEGTEGLDLGLFTSIVELITDVIVEIATLCDARRPNSPDIEFVRAWQKPAPRGFRGRRQRRQLRRVYRLAMIRGEEVITDDRARHRVVIDAMREVRDMPEQDLVKIIHEARQDDVRELTLEFSAA